MSKFCNDYLNFASVQIASAPRRQGRSCISIPQVLENADDVVIWTDLKGEQKQGFCRHCSTTNWVTHNTRRKLHLMLVFIHSNRSSCFCSCKIQVINTFSNVIQRAALIETQCQEMKSFSDWLLWNQMPMLPL